MPIIQVNADGRSSDGEEYDDIASDEMVSKGYMINVPVILQHPDGRLEQSSQVRVTPSGIEFLRREIPVELRHTKGTA
ncbi:two component transcriptional regulator [Ahrensia sp. R2A130]|nr:two component transcriptional regulator [Ahrensia sp. R2A130]